MIMNLVNDKIEYKVFHEEFDPNKVYKAIAYITFGETAWAQLVFINEQGMTYSVMVYKTRCVDPFHRDATADEASLAPCKPKGRSSDINEVDLAYKGPSNNPTEEVKPAEVIPAFPPPDRRTLVRKKMSVSDGGNGNGAFHKLTQLRLERRSRRLTSLEMARMVFMSPSMYSRVELCEAPVHRDDAIVISGVLNVPINELFDDRGFAIVVTPPTRVQT